MTLRVNTQLSILVRYVQFVLMLDITDHSADLHVSKVTQMFEIFQYPLRKAVCCFMQWSDVGHPCQNATDDVMQSLHDM
jgi:hypothetical protein